MAHAARTPKVLGPGEGKRAQILAETGWLKLGGEETGGTYAIMEGQTPPNAGPPLHRHSREDESFFVLEGDYQFNVGETMIPAPAGTFVFGPRGIPHTFKNVGATVARMLIVAQPAGVEKFFEEVSVMLGAGSPDLAELGALAARYGIEMMG